MFRNYLLTAWRNIVRHKGYSLITIAGFALGLACCLTIMLYILDEMSYDRFYPNADRTVRIDVDASWADNTASMATTSAPLAALIRREIPEVEAVTRFRYYGAPVLRHGEKCFSEERFFFADPTFFDVFSVSFIQGDPRHALAQPNAVAISLSMARKYFGSAEALGKVLTADNRRDYIVSGVFADLPPQTHFHYDFIAPFGNRRDTQVDSYATNNNFSTYLRLRPDITITRFAAKLDRLVQTFAHPELEKLFGNSWAKLTQGGAYFRWLPRPLTDIHLRSHRDFEIETNSDIRYVYVFSLIAFAIFVLACVNFINLTTARATTRAREVGIRKSIGSSRGELVRQFFSEILLLVFLAVLIAVVLAQLLSPYLGLSAEKGAPTAVLANRSLLPLLGGLLLLSSLLAGAYPAFLLSSFKPAAVLKGDPLMSKKSTLRGLLVVLQFSVSIIMIIGTLVVSRQLHFMQDRDLGFGKEQVLVIRKANDLGKGVRAFKQELLARPDVVSVSSASHLMGDPEFGDELYKNPDAPAAQLMKLQRLFCDENFARVFQLRLAGGRFFDKSRPADRKGIVINEAAARALGMSDPAGKQLISMGGERIPVLGVVKDFHFQSLRQRILPMAINYWGEDAFGPLLAVRIATPDMRQALAGIRRIWERHSRGQSFDFQFFDDRFARVYAAESRLSGQLLAFSILAIVIACLGLLGLSIFIVRQRTKEIGIRKVLGASMTRISWLLSGEFLKHVLLASVIACPIAYFLMKRWLGDFAFRIGLDAGPFALAVLITVGVSLATIGVQVVRAARANPVDSLRYE